jgi:hypothetical protein
VSRSRFGRACTRACMLACSAAVIAGCYVYTPAPVTPAAGSHLLLELNDRGRVGLGDSIGPSAQTIEGTTIFGSDSAFKLGVTRVGYLNGQSNKWSGEPLLIARDFVAKVTQEKFSKSRTWLTATGLTAAAVAFISSRGLLGFGSEAKTGGGGNKKTD